MLNQGTHFRHCTLTYRHVILIRQTELNHHIILSTNMIHSLTQKYGTVTILLVWPMPVSSLMITWQRPLSTTRITWQLLVGSTAFQTRWGGARERMTGLMNGFRSTLGEQLKCVLLLHRDVQGNMQQTSSCLSRPVETPPGQLIWTKMALKWWDWISSIHVILLTGA